MPKEEYTDRDGVRLLEQLAKYAEAFRDDHVDPELTVKELAEDLCDTMGGESLAIAHDYKDRIYDGLNGIPRGDI